MDFSSLEVKKISPHDSYNSCLVSLRGKLILLLSKGLYTIVITAVSIIITYTTVTVSSIEIYLYKTTKMDYSSDNLFHELPFHEFEMDNLFHELPFHDSSSFQVIQRFQRKMSFLKDWQTIIFQGIC